MRYNNIQVTDRGDRIVKRKQSKLSGKAEEIRKNFASGDYTLERLAQDYDVHPNSIKHVINGDSLRYEPGPIIDRKLGRGPKPFKKFRVK